jgi:hypothetical protein
LVARRIKGESADSKWKWQTSTAPLPGLTGIYTDKYPVAGIACIQMLQMVGINCQYLQMLGLQSTRLPPSSPKDTRVRGTGSDTTQQDQK